MDIQMDMEEKTTVKKLKVIISVGIVIVCLIIIIYLWHMWRVDSYLSTIDNNSYNIINRFSDIEKQQAADTIAKINIFIIDIIRHLRLKYKYSGDGISDGNLSLNDKLNVVNKLLLRYDPNKLKENNPLTTKNTSYVLDKGSEVAFCLREKISGKNNFHDFNTIQFVVLHEMGHIGTSSFGHGKQFWKTFKFLTEEAHMAGLYDPVDYSKHHINYCGLDVTMNPFFHDIDRLM